MKILICLSFILFIFSLEKNSTETNRTDFKTCDWYQEISNTENQEEKIKLIKINYLDLDKIELKKANPDICKVIFILSVNEQYWLLTSYNFSNPEKVIQSIKSEEIEFITVFEKKAAKALYNTDGVILMSSSSKELEERVLKIKFGKI